jgi:hypothetical protein
MSGMVRSPSDTHVSKCVGRALFSLVHARLQFAGATTFNRSILGWMVSSVEDMSEMVRV